jgi:4-carboxymuconolactone decarboxylase
MPRPLPSRRLTPLAAEDQEEEHRKLLAFTSTPGVHAVHLFATLARHPGLLRQWMPFAAKLHGGKLSARHRELVVLRTGWRCGADYEWGHHVLASADAGLTPAELERIRSSSYAGWEPLEAALLRCADELHDTSSVSDDTWQVLATNYDERQLIELIMLVGHYHLVCFAANALGIQREPEVPGFDT